MAEQKKIQEQDVNQLRKVRREKFADLQENGMNSISDYKIRVTHHSMEIKEILRNRG